MSIKVTLGEAKTHEEKSFPKLMKGDRGRILEVLEKPDSTGLCPVIVRVPNHGFQKFFTLDGCEKFTDYNEPITLQNE